MLRFGVNYVPSKDWFYSWQDVDKTATDEDMHAIKEIGADHIRMHLRWDIFQPNEAFVCPKPLKDLVAVLDSAGRYGLDVEITALNGWMSGFWFLPSFAGDKSIITDGGIIAAEKYFLQELAQATADHPALMGVDIGNEINMFGANRIPFTVSEGDRWLREMLGLTDELFPDKINVVGVDHQPWFSDAYFSREALSSAGSVTALHCWTGFSGALKYGADSEECLGLQRFCIELADAYARPGRKAWVQEFGITDEWVSEDSFERYMVASMDAAAECENLWGFTWWCSHDIDRRFKGFNSMEYGLGLLDTANRPKPLAAEYKRQIEKMKKRGAGERQTAKMPESGTGERKGAAIVIDESEPFDGWKYGRAFARFSRQGRHMKFVTSSRADDENYLADRGITELVKL